MIENDTATVYTLWGINRQMIYDMKLMMSAHVNIDQRDHGDVMEK